ncbi:MAG TPA: tetratricopeptide repeat protein [Planctomycetaceae bacterium]
MSDHAPPSPPAPPPVLAGERVTFTGKLASMTHQQASELVERHGGKATEHASRQTTLLVVGEEGWPLEADGKPAQKFRQVQEWREHGAAIRVLRESDWLHLLGLSDRRGEVHRLYTPAMLGQMLDLPVSLIRRWERVGLLRAAKRVCRLPYFDFQEVARLRRLAELLDAGISREELEESLAALAELFPEAGGPKAKLDLLARDSRVYLRDDRGLLEPSSGQRVFDFEDGSSLPNDAPASLPLETRSPTPPACSSAAEWFSRGCALLEEDQPAAAVEAFRMALMLRPGDAEAQFCLADALYRSGNAAGALERFYAVVETDRKYLEAWTQIGCLHAERDEHDAAIAAFHVALDLHPDYPDAHLHLAEALHAAGRAAEAEPHWRRYLEFDRRGPWADLARQRLGLDDEV